MQKLKIVNYSWKNTKCSIILCPIFTRLSSLFSRFQWMACFWKSIKSIIRTPIFQVSFFQNLFASYWSDWTASLFEVLELNDVLTSIFRVSVNDCTGSYRAFNYSLPGNCERNLFSIFIAKYRNFSWKIKKVLLMCSLLIIALSPSTAASTTHSRNLLTSRRNGLIWNFVAKSNWEIEDNFNGVSLV